MSRPTAHPVRARLARVLRANLIGSLSIDALLGRQGAEVTTSVLRKEVGTERQRNARHPSIGICRNCGGARWANHTRSVHNREPAAAHIHKSGERGTRMVRRAADIGRQGERHRSRKAAYFHRPWERRTAARAAERHTLAGRAFGRQGGVIRRGRRRITDWGAYGRWRIGPEGDNNRGDTENNRRSGPARAAPSQLMAIEADITQNSYGTSSGLESSTCYLPLGY